MQLFIFSYVGIVGGDAVTVFWEEDEDDESSMENVDANDDVPNAWFKGQFKELWLKFVRLIRHCMYCGRCRFQFYLK